MTNVYFFVLFAVTSNCIIADNIDISSIDMNSAVWKIGTHYTFNVALRTLSYVKQRDYWYGTVVKSKLEIYAESNQNIIGVLREAKIFKIDHIMKTGFQGPLPQNLENKDYPEIEKPFRLRINGGLIEVLEISGEMGWQEVTLLKGILAALQYDSISIYVEGFDYILGEENQSGSFQSEENGVAGICRTDYEIVPKDIDDVNRSILRATSSKTSKKPVELFEITRITNLSRCVKGAAFKNDVLESTHYRAGNFSKRSTICRTITDRSSNTIYSSHLFTNVIYKRPVNGYGLTRHSIQSSVKIVLTSIKKVRKNDTMFKLCSKLKSSSILYSISKNDNYKIIAFYDPKRGLLGQETGCQDKEQPNVCKNFDCFCAHLFANIIILLLPV